ncbi:D-3-phosphoglycerate dehydrogenase [Ramlibacter sp. AW1]|uniref:D-3-phosphoglycerate dehydrogenase n=1 Tax=Ramlibacter aurantiacus TaxID=2801330 RepID=A0A936ZZM1_9BURK|nr:NAD(P)-dependent oxidoreductase [Ramlibacter aurantiacus]MBL0423374.1 D-3-phosphoglycerate dehydrogenase [Ramlibacter aurantiacus]
MSAAMPPRVFIVRDHTMDPLLDDLAAQLQATGVEVTRGPVNQPGVVRPLPDEVVSHGLAPADVAVFSSRWRCPRETLLAAPRLKGIVGATIGVETIDLQAADELGLIVGHGGAPEHIASMAEATVMLMLNLRYALAHSQAVMRGDEPRPAILDVRAAMLQGSTVGLVGLGRIGKAVMERLGAFGVRLLAYSPRVDPAAVPDHVELVSLERLMAESDTVGLFVAVRPDNRHLVNARTLALMKPSAFLVNVARGEAVDEPALVEALRTRRIAGAALDTFEVEPLPADSPLRTLDNVILTPHMVGHTRESVRSIPRIAFENVTRILAGELPVSCKNPYLEPAWRRRLHALGAGRAA